LKTSEEKKLVQKGRGFLPRPLFMVNVKVGEKQGHDDDDDDAPWEITQLRSAALVNFINVFARFFRTKFWRQSQNVTRKAAKT